jgi:L-aminopeptidase/D-esterase-like protein
VQATKIAQMAQHGLVRTIRPVHTTLDGDLVITLATGAVDADVNLVGLAAGDAVAAAIVRAVTEATPLGGLPSGNDIAKRMAHGGEGA